MSIKARLKRIDDLLNECEAKVMPILISKAAAKRYWKAASEDEPARKSSVNNTTDQDHIRKAVGLADNWEMLSSQTFGMSGTSFLLTSQVGRDALAAQLVRQVDEAIPDGFLDIMHDKTRLIYIGSVMTVTGKDRAMTTIKCVNASNILATSR